MQFATPRQRPQEEPILPLINVVFLLLIFVMLAGSLASGDPIEAEPPVSANEGQIAARDLVIVIGAEGEIAVDGAVIKRSDLANALASALGGDAPRGIWLKADAQADSLDVIALMDALQAAGAEQLQLLTAQAEP